MVNSKFIPQNLRHHEYIINICKLAASMSQCPKASVGAVFVNNQFEVLSIGYNGTSRGMQECMETKHEFENNHIHAEMNAMLQAVNNGTNLKGATLYCSLMPCRLCLMLLIQIGVNQVYIGKMYDRKKWVFETSNLPQDKIYVHDWSNFQRLL